MMFYAWAFECRRITACTFTIHKLYLIAGNSANRVTDGTFHVRKSPNLFVLFFGSKNCFGPESV